MATFYTWAKRLVVAFVLVSVGFVAATYAQGGDIGDVISDANNVISGDDTAHPSVNAVDKITIQQNTMTVRHDWRADADDIFIDTPDGETLHMRNGGLGEKGSFKRDYWPSGEYRVRTYDFSFDERKKLAEDNVTIDPSDQAISG